MALAMPLTAQAPAAAQPAPAPDSVVHHSAPFTYFFRSGLIPGWGQASLDRKLTGALFVAFEGLAISMALKTSTELKFLDVADSATASVAAAPNDRTGLS